MQDVVIPSAAWDGYIFSENHIHHHDRHRDSLELEALIAALDSPESSQASPLRRSLLAKTGQLVVEAVRSCALIHVQKSASSCGQARCDPALSDQGMSGKLKCLPAACADIATAPHFSRRAELWFPLQKLHAAVLALYTLSSHNIHVHISRSTVA